MSKTLPVFTDAQLDTVQTLLATKVMQMGGRKLEEGDWDAIYRQALGLPEGAWSNLNIDVVMGNVGIEHKLIRTKSSANIETSCGTSYMHPALTRSIRIVADKNSDPDKTMQNVFAQYASLVEQGKAYVRSVSKLKDNAAVEMRTGWLLWQESLRQFLYFEVPTNVPSPDDYFAKWQETQSKGSRKGSLSLWIYEKTGSQRKRYSITTDAGAKIQPYFDVPPLGDPNLYIFTVIGEVINDKYVKAWITERTRSDLQKAIGSLETASLSKVILENTAGEVNHSELAELMQSEERATNVEVTANAYASLCAAFPVANDELRFRTLLVHLERRATKK
jgi:hypothetical protein